MPSPGVGHLVGAEQEAAGGDPGHRRQGEGPGPRCCRGKAHPECHACLVSMPQGVVQGQCH
eukprot:8021096-Lingulodinium_polyedra.AAC.1